MPEKLLSAIKLSNPNVDGTFMIEGENWLP